MKITFIGHSTLLIETPEARIVPDPHFRSRMLWSARVRPLGMDIEALRDVEGILLSHGHFDHLDPRTLRQFGDGAVLAVPPGLGYLAGCVLGKLVGDVFITREEIRGLMDNLLCVDSPPAGTTKLTDWVAEHAETLGRTYASELAGRRDRTLDYSA